MHQPTYETDFYALTQDQAAASYLPGGRLYRRQEAGRPPDRIAARVTISGHALTDDELRRGMRVAFPGRDNTAERRLKAGERVACEVPGVEARAAGLLQLAVSEEVYCEEGELERPVSNGFPPSRACRP